MSCLAEKIVLQWEKEANSHQKNVLLSSIYDNQNKNQMKPPATFNFENSKPLKQSEL